MPTPRSSASSGTERCAKTVSMSCFPCKTRGREPRAPFTFPSPNPLEEENPPMRVLSPLFALALIAASLLLTSTPATANHGTLSGTVTDISTGQPVANVCVTIGPPVRCATNTKADGTYFVDLAGAPDGLKWDLAFFINGVKKADFPGTVVN